MGTLPASCRLTASNGRGQEGKCTMNHERDSLSYAGGAHQERVFAKSPLLGAPYGQQQLVRGTPSDHAGALINGALIWHGESKDATTEQRALDAIGTTVQRELDNRRTLIAQLQDEGLSMRWELENREKLHAEEVQRLKGGKDYAEKKYLESVRRADLYYVALDQVCALVLPEGEACDVDGIPGRLKNLLERIADRGLGHGMFDDPVADDALWRHLARVTGRDPDTGMPCAPTSTTDAVTYGSQTGTATAEFPLVGASVITNDGKLDISVQGERDVEANR